MTTAAEETEVKVELMKQRYGATLSLPALFDTDHKAAHYRRVFVHDAKMPMIQYCAACMEQYRYNEALDERRQLLMNDLLDETVWIRSSGYKTMRKAVVGVYPYRSTLRGEPDSEPEYRLLFNYTGEDRGQDLRRMKRLDVQIEGERLNVWDDGEDDLSEWDRGKHSNSSKPCEKKYQSIH